MGDFFDDFDGDYDDGFEDEFDNDEDDAGFNDISSESEMDQPDTDEADQLLEAETDPCCRIEWQDWMLIGPISEEMAKEKAEEERLLRESDKDDKD